MLSLPYFGQRISNDINVTSNDGQIGRGIIPTWTKYFKYFQLREFLYNSARCPAMGMGGVLFWFLFRN